MARIGEVNQKPETRNQNLERASGFWFLVSGLSSRLRD
jgi:hypothetical protein